MERCALAISTLASASAVTLRPVLPVSTKASFTGSAARAGSANTARTNSAARARATTGSARDIAAIDHQLGAGDEFGLVGGEIDRAPGDVVGLAHMAERVERIRRLAAFRQIAQAGEMLFHHRRPDEAGMDGIHADAVARIKQRVSL